jgi:hypothetical protein
MNVRMMFEFLVPCVQDAEEPDLRAEALGRWGSRATSSSVSALARNNRA